MTLRYRFLTTLLLITSVIPGLRAEDEPGASSRDSDASEWSVTTIAGQKILAQELNVYAEGWLLNEGDDFRSVAATEIFSVMNTKPTRPADSSRGAIVRLYLSNGDRLAGQLVTLSEVELALKPLVRSSGHETGEPESGQPSRDADSKSATRLKIPFESVRALEWLPSATSPAQVDLLAFEDSANHDVLKLSNGDRLSGDLTTIALDNLEFVDDQGARTIPTSEVRAILINPELLIEPEDVNNYWRIALSDGSLLTLTRLTLLDFNRFELQTVLAGTYRVPLEQVVSISRFSENIVPLSRRAPEEINYTPFLSSTPPRQLDRNVSGGPMQMAGGRYLTGIGVHSRTAMKWAVEESDSRFLSDIGIDDSTKGGGSVTFSVLLDGEIVFESGPVRGGQRPRLIDIDVTGKKTLTLLVDFGEGGDVLDRANWGHAVIVREKPETRNKKPATRN